MWNNSVLHKAKLLSLSHRPSRAFISIWIVYVITVGFFPQPFQMAACWSLLFKGSGFVGAQSVVWQLTECEGWADCTYYKTYWSIFQRSSWTRCFYECCEQKGEGDAVTSMHICCLPMEVLPCLAWFPFCLVLNGNNFAELISWTFLLFINSWPVAFNYNSFFLFLCKDIVWNCVCMFEGAHWYCHSLADQSSCWVRIEKTHL